MSGAGNGSAAAAGRLSKLVLHVDINGTVMLADSAQGRSGMAALRHLLIRHYGHAEVKAKMSEYLSPITWPSAVPVVEALAEREQGQDVCIFRVFNSFFKLLLWLTDNHRDFVLVFRSFGTDFSPVARALAAFAASKHPLYPLRGHDLSRLVFHHDSVHRVVRQEGGLALRRGEEHVVDGEGLYDFFSRQQSTIAVSDDYVYWESNDFAEAHGKPFFLCESTPHVHHVFFDDHISSTARSSCVGVRVRARGRARFEPHSVEALEDIMDKYMVRVDTLEALRDEDYFIRKLQECEARFSSRRTVVPDAKPPV